MTFSNYDIRITQGKEIVLTCLALPTFEQKGGFDLLNISGGIGEFGSIQWYMVLCLILAWVLVFLCLIFGPRSLGKIVYVTVFVPYIIFLSLLVRCCLEDGSIDGIRLFLKPQWNKLSNLKLWVEGGALMLTSLGLGTGCLTTLAGYSHFHSHCFSNGTWIFHISCCHGPVSHFKGLGDIVLCVGHYDWTDHSVCPCTECCIWSFTYGTKQTALQMEIQLCYISCCLCYLAGLFIIHFLNSSSWKTELLSLVVLMEVLILGWLYRAQRLWNNVLMVLTVIVDWSVSYRSYNYPEWTLVLGCLISVLCLLPVPLAIMWILLRRTDTVLQTIRSLMTTPSNWGPGVLANQEHHSELPDYVICTPDVYKPENALAILTANLYIPNLANLVSMQDPDDPGMTGTSYLSDMMTVDSAGESDDSDEENTDRGNWSSRLDFVLSCLGYVVGLGNVWRFPFLVYRNGGGAFFIPYFIMLIFCGIPLVYMELSFGIGISMVLASMLVSVYYNVVNAWAFHYLFSSMVDSLPWLRCDNAWNNKETCSVNKFQMENCSQVNLTYIESEKFVNHSCYDTLSLCTQTNNTQDVSSCIWELQKTFGDQVLLDFHSHKQNLTSPSEEYFYNRVLHRSGNLSHLGDIQWELALCLLLSWFIVFVCLVKGIRFSGKKRHFGCSQYGNLLAESQSFSLGFCFFIPFLKQYVVQVAYFVVFFPFLIILALLIRAVMMEGNMEGIRFYTTPKWEKLSDPHVWADAAVQVFFSLSACMGGLTTLYLLTLYSLECYTPVFHLVLLISVLTIIYISSYVIIFNIVDAVLICLGDTLMSVLAGFSVFSIMGVLAKELNTSLENVILSEIGLTFIVNPAAMSYFPIAPLWSILFFSMIIMLGLSTQFVNIEVIITAVVDENFKILKRRRILVLFLGGMYVLQLMDQYVSGFPIMINGIFMCIAIGWVYGVQTFAGDIKQMIGHHVGYTWRGLWCIVTPLIISFILVFSGINYQPLSDSQGKNFYPDWADGIGFIIMFIPVLAIPVWAVYQLASLDGSFLQRLKMACRSQSNWGPALERNWKNIEYYPAVNTNTLTVDIEHSPLHTVTDRVDFTTVGVRVPSLSSQTSLISKPLSPKKPRDMRERAILNHAYSNPQCHIEIHGTNFAKKKIFSVFKYHLSIIFYVFYSQTKRKPQTSTTTTTTTTTTAASSSSSSSTATNCSSDKWNEECPAVLESFFHQFASKHDIVYVLRLSLPDFYYGTKSIFVLKFLHKKRKSPI
ncbi:hypothetical protein KUTeg_024406 [Tegillarca granosa]|uniref:Transporter n=1 Tax=Tegillarca granosa TaxID=220873 RepID=A0ABQ9DYA4_TEGGR|nr:hypothetical protein KUTeg_024406 [Tegillarca granosa]